MDKINTMLLIDIVIVILGIVLLVKAIRMAKTRRVDGFIIPEETLKKCKAKNIGRMAEFIAPRMIATSLVMIAAGGCMIFHEVVIQLGIFYYITVAILTISVLVFYKQLTDARVRYS